MCFGIVAGFTALSIFAMLLWALTDLIFGAPLYAPTGYWVPIAAVVAIGELIYLWLAWFALYGAQLWAKWTCMGFAVLWMVYPGVVALGCVREMLSGYVAGHSGEVVTALLLVGVLPLAFQAWFISVLYRDARRIQQG